MPSVSDFTTAVTQLFTELRSLANAQLQGVDAALIGTLDGPLADTLVLLDDIEDAILDAVDGLVIPPAADFDQELADALSGAGISFLTAVSTGDTVALTLDTAPTVDIDDVSTDGLLPAGFGLDFASDLDLGGSVDLDLGFEFDPDTGEIIFDDTLGANTVGFAISAMLNIPANLTGTLGFLSVELEDGAGVNGAEVTVDVSFPDGVLGSVAADVALDFEAGLSLDLTASASSDFLPSISGTFVATYDAGVDATSLGALTEVGVQDVTIGIEAFQNLFGDLFGGIADVTSGFPLGPIIKLFSSSLPLFQQLQTLFPGLDAVGNDGEVTLLDLLAMFGGQSDSFDMIVALTNMIEAVAALGELSSFVTDGIPLGDVTFSAEALDALNAGGTGIGLTNIFDTTFAGALPDLPDAFAALEPYGLSFPLLSDDGPRLLGHVLFSEFLSDDETPPVPVGLIEFQLPVLELPRDQASFEFSIPLGPFAFVLEGGFAAQFQIGLGYSTRGLADGLGGFLDGLYLTTGEDANGDEVPLANFTADIGAGFGISVPGLRVTIDGGFEGTVDMFLADNSDGVDDGMAHLSGMQLPCIFDPIEGELTAGVGVTFRIGVSFLSVSFSVTFAEIVIANFSMGCAGPHGQDAPILDNVGLATRDGASLWLNVGERAEDFRDLPQGVGDGVIDETFSVTRMELPAAGEETDPAYDPNALQVNAFGVGELFDDSGVTLIEADGDEGRDVFTIAQGIDIAARFSGGGGNDVFVTQGGDDFIEGNDGNDLISTGDGDDTVRGGSGDDTIRGSLGADRIEGNEDTDQVDYSASGEAVYLMRVGATVFGSGGLAEGDVITNAEYFIGTDYADILTGDESSSNILDGGGDDDILTGGSGVDLLIGGAGADLMDGRANSGDIASYVTSLGGVTVNLETGQASRADAEGDQLLRVEGLHGSMHDDVFTGTDDANFLDGFAGDDLIRPAGGADTVLGGGGNDTIMALGTGALLDGGGGQSERFDRDLLSYALAENGVVARLAPNLFSDGLSNDDSIEGFQYNPDSLTRSLLTSSFEDLEGSSFNDTLGGDIDNNQIWGLDGNDSIDAEAGDDTVSGGDGGDDLDGNTGTDLLDYSQSDAGVDVDLSTGTADFGHAAEDTIAGFENLLGSDFNDTLVGDGGTNVIDPGLSLGADSVNGGTGGSDVLRLDYSGLDTSVGFAGGVGLGVGGSQGAFGFGAGGASSGVIFDEIERFDITGSLMGDVIVTGDDDDTINSGGGDDIVLAGLGQDIVRAGAGNDLVFSQIGDVDTEFGVIGGGDFFYLDGGDGIDGLSVDLSEAPNAIALMLPDPLVELQGVYVGFEHGGAIANFEFIGTVAGTGFSDLLGQGGRIDNHFLGAAGDDTLAPGLGMDTVDGGETSLDPTLLTDADFLILDYSVGETGSGVSVTAGGAGELDAVRTEPIQIGAQTYQNPVDVLEARNIEYTHIVGTMHGDLIEGINDTFYSERGDTLEGRDGNDTLTSFNGADALLGGAGSDSLQSGQGDDSLQAGLAGRDDGRDTMVGGSGDDRFILGDSTGLHYGEMADGAVTNDIAIIDDFVASDDVIQLSGSASDYVLYEAAGHTFIERVSDNVTIAQITGASDLDINDPQFEFVPEASALGGIGGVGGVALALTLPAEVAAEGAQLLAHEVTHTTSGGSLPLAAPTGSGDGFDLEIDAALPLIEGDDGGGSRALPAPFSVDQGLNLGDFDQMLSGAFAAQGVTFTIGSASLERTGDARAFGTFENGLGLDEGIVISNGDAEHLPGQNMEDGGLISHQFGGLTVDLDFEPIGVMDVGTNQMTFYRADLSQVPFEIASLILTDDNDGTGGFGGAFSGADIAGLAITSLDFDDINALTGGDPAQLGDSAILPRLDLFDFTPAGAILTPGDQRLIDLTPPAEGETTDYPSGMASPDLIGSFGGYLNNAQATLGDFDYFVDGNGVGSDQGFLSLGEGGSLGLNLNQTLPANEPVWLIVAEAGGSEAFEGQFTASSEPLPPPGDLSTDFGAEGAEGDTVSFTFTFDVSLPDGEPMYVQLADLVLVSEELREFSGTELQDSLSVTINGEPAANLSDGAELALERLALGPVGPYHDDLQLNLAEDANGSADETRGDAYTVAIPVAGYLVDGTNTFTVTVADNRDGLLDTAILLSAPTVTGPVSPPDTSAPPMVDFTISEEGVLNGDLSNELGPGLSFELIPGGAAANGKLELGVNGTFTYAPNDDFFGDDLFYYVATGPGGVEQIGVARIDVTPVDDPIEAADDDLSVVQGDTLTGNIFDDNGFGIDIDPDGEFFGAFQINGMNGLIGTTTTLASGAELLLNVDGSFTYDPTGVFPFLEQGETALDSFTYAIRNVSGQTDTATASLHIRSIYPDAMLTATDGPDQIVGTNNADTLLAQSGDDLILGLAGDDSIEGNRDNDTINGGLGDDTVIGGNGIDTVSYEDALGDVSVYLQWGTASGAAGNDSLSSVEGVIGSDFDDRLFGQTDLPNTLVGGLGDDRIETRGGRSQGSGDEGNDSLFGGALEDTLSGGGQEDFVLGGNGDDLVFGGNGDDTVRGNRGNDTIDGGRGGDRVEGGRGNDTLTGERGMDLLFGDRGNDSLDGGEDLDYLYGGDGSDTLNGGPGDDRLTTGADSDLIIFAPGDGADRINDWGVGQDRVDLSEFEIADFDALVLLADDTPSGVRFYFASGDSLFFADTALASLASGDFDL